MEKKAKEEQKAINKATKQAKALKAKADREALKLRNASMPKRITRSKAGGCGCGCNKLV